MSKDEREAMINTLSVMLFKDAAYYENMSDERIIEEYENMMKII